ncbi:tetratricopeptide repeat protein [Rhodopirellula sp. MGV]|uniref:tetratricopeptide repeat protein n=1 Tax=Rhodopirellula sp. MGV TaxID=2023130 RepID=UPI0013047508|nr:tetratricopeptide repeat protein [Rhodopirellula sp. MGV]
MEGRAWLRRSLRSLLIATLAACCVSGLGCRTIRKIGNNGETLGARRLSRSGMEFMRQGQWDQAEHLFQEALALCKTDDRAHRGLSEAYWKRDQKDAAIKHMETAVKLSEQDPRLVVRLGQMYFDVGRLDDAEAQAKIAFAAQRDMADTWVLSGDCLSARHNRDEALAAYHRALALQPDFVDVKMRVAEIYLSDEQYDRVLATLDRAEDESSFASLPTRVHMLRGIAMKNLGRPELAIKHFAKAKLQSPEMAEPCLQIASIRLSEGDTIAASQEIAEAMQLNEGLVVESGWSKFLLTPEQLAAQKADQDRKLR